MTRAPRAKAAPGAEGALVRAPDGPVKTAELLARRMEADIVKAGWPVGSLLGSESELIERYAVSRGVLREAIRLLEHHNVVGTRRGRGGGLIVTEPEASVVARSMSLYLQFLQIGANELDEARMVAEMACVELAAAHIDDEGREQLSRHLDAEAEAADGPDQHSTHLQFHVLVGALSKNAVLGLNVRSMAALVDEWYGDDGTTSTGAAESRRAHKSIANAIMAGNVEAAARRMRRHLLAMSPHLQKKRGSAR